MNRLLHAFLIVLLLPIFSWSDVIILNNGNRIEGVIQDSGGDVLYVETPGGRLSIPRNTIDRIEEHTLSENLFLQGQREEAQNNWPGAIESYADSLRRTSSAAETRRVKARLEQALDRYIRNIEERAPLQHGLDEIATLEELKRKISEPDLLARLQEALRTRENEVANAYYNEGKRLERIESYTEAIEAYQTLLENFPQFPLSNNLDRTIVNLQVRIGRNLYNQTRRPSPEARSIFREVLDKDPANAEALYYMGLMAYQDDDLERAREYLAQVNAFDLGPNQANDFRNLQRRLELNQRQPQSQQSSPSFEPPASGATTQTPPPTDASAPWYERWWRRIQDAASRLTTDPASMMTSVVEWGIFLAVAIFILYAGWLWPVRWVNKDIRNRRVMYANWRQIVKYTGVLGALAYMLDKWRLEKPERRCPGCNRSLDNPDIFTDYQFNHCPYCDLEIKPAFTMPQLIEVRSESISVARGAPGNAMDDSQRDAMIQLVEDILAFARMERASDVHIEPEETRLLVRFRIDGVIQDSVTLQPNLSPLMISCIKIMSSLNIAEKRLPQDGHFKASLLGSDLNIRVSTIPTRQGEKAVLRLLDPKIATVTLDTLGMREEMLERYRRAISASHGLILATGPTGSGKTTLHYASLQILNDGSKNIVTVEDPIEYDLDGINQIQQNLTTGLTFATALRSILRQDPDVIMVGEIRDTETATISVNAALTGHTVFSTLHTIDTSTAVSRLIDIGADIRQLSSALRCIVAQRLVRKLCPHCKVKGAATVEQLRSLGEDSPLLEGQSIYTATGCEACNQSGYSGRTGIYELLFPTDDIRALIEQSASAREIRTASRAAGMKSLRQEGILKVLTGETSVEEVIRVTSDETVHDTSESLSPE